jgi:plasmid stability protein
MPMNPIIIRHLDDATVYRLRQLAWQEGCPLEEMARQLLNEAVNLRATPLPESAVRSPDFDQI